MTIQLLIADDHDHGHASPATHDSPRVDQWSIDDAVRRQLELCTHS